MGAAGEVAARRHIEAQGMRVVEEDWRNRLGQIDLVALDGDTLVLIEVKARRSARFGVPQEAVNARKRQKLRQLLEAYRAATRRQSQPCRIDVVGLLLSEQCEVIRCDHIRDAVQDV